MGNRGYDIVAPKVQTRFKDLEENRMIEEVAAKIGKKH